MGTESRSKALWAAALVSAAQGCLVADPPEFEDPQQTRPFVHLTKTFPFPGDILILERRTDGGASVTLTLHVQSEDLGEPLTVAVHLDGGQPGGPPFRESDFAPATFDQPRDLVLENLNLSNQADGCHRLTAIVAHASRFNRTPADGFVRPGEEDWSESVRWTVNIVGGADVPVSINDCVMSDDN